MEAKKAQELTAKISQIINAAHFPELAKIEHDLLLQHIRNLYDELSTNSSANEPKTSTGKQPEEMLIRRTFRANDKLLLNDIPPVKKEELKSPDPIILPTREETKPAVEETVQEVKQEAKQASVVTPTPVNEVSELSTAVAPAPEVSITVPEIKTATPARISASINESIHAASGSLNERIKTSHKEIHKVISNKQLKNMIDLNSRFVFVSELFKGNKDEFNFAVTHIDEIADYTSAEGFIRSQLINTHKWDETSPTVQSFMALVRTKFGVE